MNSPKVRQALVEYFRHVAKTRNNAQWSHHSALYMYFQQWVSSIISESKSFTEFPVMFSSYDRLEVWAKCKGLEIRNLTSGQNVNAVLTVGVDGAEPLYDGTNFVWVKASWGGYRKALMHWVDKDRSYAKLTRHHEDAATIYAGAAEALKNRDIRPYLSKNERSKLGSTLKSLAELHGEWSLDEQLAKKNEEFLQTLDCILDADHVLNKSSLKNIPDAWVLLAPVTADSNRGFGRHIERYSMRVAKGVNSVSLTPAVTFKLFSAMMPVDSSELETQLGYIKNKFLLTPGLEAEMEEMEKIIGDCVLRRKVRRSSNKYMSKAWKLITP
ncbi:hypothetical protein [Pseudomonas frederiksbergensis]|uniref:hypothetical protein n=1 Tax=Pseudomonas frederiksbergensis TaxID=104087 RepID=UPI0011CE3D91|nr:hypothetical protein [Pseudomonas frederiksbergensis]